MTKVEAGLRQRVVGAGVLVALAIVILPMLLDGTAEERARVLSQIPKPPVIETEDLKVEDVLTRMETLAKESQAKLPRSKTEDSASTDAGSLDASKDDSRTLPLDVSKIETGEENKKALSLDTDGLPIAWSLQVGSFAEPANALKLRETLRKLSHQTYVHRAQTGKGETYRVFIGPVLNRMLLESIADKVKSEQGLKGQIVRYDSKTDKDLVGG